MKIAETERPDKPENLLNDITAEELDSIRQFVRMMLRRRRGETICQPDCKSYFTRENCYFCIRRDEVRDRYETDSEAYLSRGEQDET